MAGQKNTDLDDDMEMIRSLKSNSKSEMRRAQDPDAKFLN